MKKGLRFAEYYYYYYIYLNMVTVSCAAKQGHSK